MENDYYQILEVSKSSSEDEIKKSYKKLALKYHPDNNKTAGAEERFKKIEEAYKVLSDQKKREEYDIDPHLFMVRVQQFHECAIKFRTILAQFMKTLQEPDIELDLYLSSAEQIEGCTKNIEISRWVQQPDGTNKIEEKELIINVKPGIRVGTRFVFKSEGALRLHYKKPADIIFTVKDK